MVEIQFPDNSPPDFSMNAASPQDWLLAPVPSPRKPKKWKLIAVIAGVVVTLATLGIVLWLNTTPRCLDISAYKALTDMDYGDETFSPTESFYAYTIDFMTADIAYDSTVAPNGQEIVDHIADFYKDYSSRSILLTIGSPYYTADSASVAQRRIDKLRTGLIAAGVPESIIISNQPTQIGAEFESDVATIATVTITSDTTCK